MKTTVRRADRFSDERSLRQIEAPLPGQDTAKKKKKRIFKHPRSYCHKTHFCATAATSNPEGADAKTLRAIRTFGRWCRRAQPITTLEPGRSEVIIASWIIRSASTKEDSALSGWRAAVPGPQRRYRKNSNAGKTYQTDAVEVSDMRHSIIGAPRRTCVS